MGIVMILLGLVSVGLMVDFSIENHLGTTASQPFELLGTSMHLSRETLVLVAFVAGALSIVFIALGMRLVRRGRDRRRELKRRVGDLERENDELRTSEPDVVVVRDQVAGGDPSMRAGTPHG